MATAYSLDGVVVDAVPPALALYPYGVFTSLVVVDGATLGWELHEDRLAAGVRELWGHELDRGRVRELVRRQLDTQAAGPVSLRITAYPATFDLAAPESASGCRLLLSSAPCSPTNRSADLAARGVQHARGLPHLKTTDLLAPLALRREARLAGFDDALLMAGDQVLEGTTWSVLLWRDGRTLTPREGVLPSITIALLEAVAGGLGFQPDTGPVTLADLAAADLVLAVNVNHPTRALSRVDDTAIPVGRALLEAVATAYGRLESQPIQDLRP